MDQLAEALGGATDGPEVDFVTSRWMHEHYAL